MTFGRTASRSIHPEVFCQKDVLRNFAKFTGKHLCQNHFLNKPFNKPFLKEDIWWLLFCFRKPKPLSAPNMLIYLNISTNRCIKNSRLPRSGSLRPYTLHRINTSGMQITPVFKKIFFHKVERLKSWCYENNYSRWLFLRKRSIVDVWQGFGCARVLTMSGFWNFDNSLLSCCLMRRRPLRRSVWFYRIYLLINGSPRLSPWNAVVQTMEYQSGNSKICFTTWS